MNYYYNKEGIGDTLIIDFLKGNATEVNQKKAGDVVVLTDEAGNVLGANVFNASEHLKVEGKGKIKTDNSFVASLNQLFKENGFDMSFNVDAMPDFIIGHVVSKEKHPDADKLSVCQVDIGETTLQIVCGAPNVDTGQNVVVARIGAQMPSGLVIKGTELRGVRSEGMICSARELGLPNAPTKKGILVLDETEVAGAAFTSGDHEAKC